MPTDVRCAGRWDEKSAHARTGLIFFFLKVRHKLVFENLSNQILVVTLFN